jgi:hypothetical protein
MPSAKMSPTCTAGCTCGRRRHGQAQQEELSPHRAHLGPDRGRGPPLTEFTAEPAGPLSPFGEDHSFPLPIDRIMYAHPTDKPNRAGLMAGEGR